MKEISAIILAAGQSSRMGVSKMSLPWGTTTVLGNVIEQILNSEIKEVHVVTGGYRQEVENILQRYGVKQVFNPYFYESEMLTSIKVGIAALGTGAQAALIALGDQPQIQRFTIEKLIHEFQISNASILIPSYQMRRGHPWIIERNFWSDILDIQSDGTMRDFFNLHQSKIHYVNVDTPSILQDLDTQEDYQTFKPG